MKQPTKREATRLKMIEAASRNFRAHGFAGVGVDAIAKSAGVTSGAFYAHLDSKGAAFLTALEVGLNEVIEAIPAFQSEHGDTWIDAFVDYYLGQPHREDMTCGCAMTALSPDVMRGDDAARGLYEEKMSAIAELVAGGLPGDDQADREVRAWSFLQVLIGGLTMSRSTLSSESSDRIAAAAKRSARAIAIGTS